MRFLQRILTLFMCLLALVGDVYAENSFNNSDKMDAVLLLDASASMQLTDPLALRNEGSRLFLQLLRPIDRLAIIQFSEKAEVLRPLSPYNREQTEVLANTISGIDANGTYTNISGAISKGVELLREGGRPDAQRALILFSDGEMSPNPTDGTPEALTAELFDKILPDAADNEIKVYTLSFSQEADQELLARVAKETSAEHWYSASAEKIHQAFADLFLVAKRPQMLPVEGEKFSIDEEIDEVTIYIGRDEDSKDVSILNPNGIMIGQHTNNPNIKWYHTSQFEVITIYTPQAGDWYIEGLSEKSGFVAVMTNLKLNMEWPQQNTEGTPFTIQARLFDASKPIALQDIYKNVEYNFTITPIDRISAPIMTETLVDDGTSGDKVANDGIFSKRITINEIGDYRIGVSASSPTFQRYQQNILHVNPRLISLAVISEAESAYAQYQKSKLHQIPNKEYFKINFAKGTEELVNKVVTLYFTGKKKNRFTHEVKKIENFFESTTDFLPDDEYEVYASLSAFDRKTKSKVLADSLPIKYSRVSSLSDDEENIEPIALYDVPVKKEVSETQKELVTFIIAVVVLTLFVALALVLSLFFVKKQINTKQSKNLGEGIKKIELMPLDSALATYKALEERAKQTEIDINSPMFTDQRYAIASSSINVDISQGNQVPQINQVLEAQTKSEPEQNSEQESNAGEE